MALVWGAVLSTATCGDNRRKDPRPLQGFKLCAPREGMSIVCCIFKVELCNGDKREIQHYTVDHLARGSMKNAANCASECELQDT